MTICPKCGHLRQPEDQAPEHECPQCGIVYAKARTEAEIPEAWKRSDRASRRGAFNSPAFSVDKPVATIVTAIALVVGAAIVMRGGTPAAIDSFARVAQRPVVTLVKYQRLANGMSYAEAVAIIGFPGTEVSRSHMDGVPGVMESLDTVMYEWANPSGANMNAMFQNNRLMQKAQFGLR